MVRSDAKNVKVVEAPVDQAGITGQYTRECLRFIEAKKDKPFFLYLPHTFPHLPLFASEAFLDKSENGRYGDSVEEIDASTKAILDKLAELELADNTLVIFTSDNGSNGRNGGSNKPLSGSKGGTMEGGMRVPFVARWPGVVPAGSRCSEVATTMDMLPTLAALAAAGGAEVEQPEREIDGHDIGPLLLGETEARSKTEVLYYYRRRQLQAVRMGAWKYHLPLEKIYPRWTSAEQSKVVEKKGALYHLPTDIGEKKKLQNAYVMRKMEAAIAAARSDLGDEAESGSEQRSAVDLERSEPLVLK